eukprot:3402798-Karenia_brevis.AAC.1
MSACGQNGQWQHATTLRLDVIIFSSAISACAKSRQWQHASSFRLDVIIFSSATTACNDELIAWQ